MKLPVCMVCGHRVIGGVAPDNCPICNAPKEKFEEMEDAIKEPTGSEDTLALEKKHIPVITVKKECGMVPEGCQDVLIRIGETLHPVAEDHSIQFIDAYLDKKVIGRFHLTTSLNPAVVIHLKPELSGKLSVVELCNLHGAWISEADL